ncbi:hypothetical protein ONZ45_g12093 [Pleurotus djamor]|nr:hypothetical protein ONZ45_g12093 [Pleurotus djamor]
MSTLTEHLLSLPRAKSSYEQATSKHPFLVAAANGTLSAPLLGYYLSQDRIYAAYAYPKFIGGLFRRIDSYHNTARPGQPKSLLPLLTASLAGVIREVGFFDEFAAEYGLDIASFTNESAPYTSRAGTLSYVAHMAYVAEWADTWEEGVIFLWAMEKVYLDAWSRIHNSLAQSSASSGIINALRVLSDNWSKEAFAKFVDDLGALVNEIATPVLESKAEEIWIRVLELEAEFWPTEAELAD